MRYELTRELETGNALIDSEHRQLLQAINDLLDACSKGQGRAKLAETTSFLSNYTTEHFNDEEKLQIQSKYPDYINHKRYHEAFKGVVANLCARLNQEGATIVLVGEVNTALGGWLIHHIKQEDQKLAEYLRKSEK